MNTRRYRMLLGFVFCILCLILTYRLTRPLSKDEVAAQAIHSLETGNVQMLLNLTLPEERQKLHLTEAGVRGFLAATIWSRGFPTHLSMKRLDQLPIDQVVYLVAPAEKSTNPLNYPFALYVTDSPDKGWHLALAITLFETVALNEHSPNPTQVGQEFVDLARKNGILGVRNNESGFLYIKP